MDHDLKTQLAVATSRNVTLRAVIEGLIARLEALEAGGGGDGPAVAQWALEGDTHIIPVSKMSETLARDTEVDQKIADAISE